MPNRSISLSVTCLLTTLLVSSSNAAVTVRFDTSYTAAEGYVAGAATQNADWTGSPSIVVDPTGAGSVTNTLSGQTDSIFHTRGALDAFASHKFGVGDRITIGAQLVFDLGSSLSTQEIARFGFGSSTTGEIEHGFGVAWDEGFTQPSEQQGTIRFFPDFNDFVLADGAAPVNVINSIGIQGRFAGLGPGDRESRPFDITYVTTHLGNDVWNVDQLSITDQVSMATFFYDFNVAPAQTFTFSGQNAFLGQNLIVQGRSSNGATATSDFIAFEYVGNPVPVAIPEPGVSAMALLFAGACAVQFRRRRKKAA